jgi:hypothetical protein
MSFVAKPRLTGMLPISSYSLDSENMKPEIKIIDYDIH